VAEPGADGDRHGPFAGVGLEFGFPLGPGDGRYLVRPSSDAAPERVIVMSTVEVERAPSRRRRRLQARPVTADAPVRAHSSRVTVIAAEPFADRPAAAAWLERLQGDRDALAQAVSDALVEVNRMLRAHRAAVADPYVPVVAESHALVRRVGYGEGDAVAYGRFEQAVDLPRPPAPRARRRARGGPQERLAAVLGANSSVLVCEELLLRARLDLDAERFREAALQARVALEAMLSELGRETPLGPALAAVREHREAVADVANAALDAELADAQRRTVAAAVERMEKALARRRAR